MKKVLNVALKVIATPFIFLVGVIFTVLVALVFVILSPVTGVMVCEEFLTPNHSDEDDIENIKAVVNPINDDNNDTVDGQA